VPIGFAVDHPMAIDGSVIRTSTRRPAAMAASRWWREGQALGAAGMRALALSISASGFGPDLLPRRDAEVVWGSQGT